VISSVLPVAPEIVQALVWSVCCFVAGVAFACYRAVSWVERMRSWARSLPDEEC
jgi:hypothetical protein